MWDVWHLVLFFSTCIVSKDKKRRRVSDDASWPFAYVCMMCTFMKTKYWLEAHTSSQRKIPPRTLTTQPLSTLKCWTEKKGLIFACSHVRIIYLAICLSLLCWQILKLEFFLPSLLSPSHMHVTSLSPQAIGPQAGTHPYQHQKNSHGRNSGRAPRIRSLAGPPSPSPAPTAKNVRRKERTIFALNIPLIYMWPRRKPLLLLLLLLALLLVLLLPLPMWSTSRPSVRPPLVHPRRHVRGRRRPPRRKTVSSAWRRRRASFAAIMMMLRERRRTNLSCLTDKWRKGECRYCI